MNRIAARQALTDHRVLACIAALVIGAPALILLGLLSTAVLLAVPVVLVAALVAAQTYREAQEQLRQAEYQRRVTRLLHVSRGLA
jgi:predicted LPLAT superfamily acyltransferase